MVLLTGVLGGAWLGLLTGCTAVAAAAGGGDEVECVVEGWLGELVVLDAAERGVTPSGRGVISPAEQQGHRYSGIACDNKDVIT
jgi:hypothetical protein